jgi:ribosomal protein L29
MHFKQQLTEKDDLISRQREELASLKTESYSLGVKVNLMEAKVKEEISKNAVLTQQVIELQKKLFQLHFSASVA